MPELQTPLPTLHPIVVLISGGGSNLQAIINAVKAGELPVEIRAVISNVANAAGLERAQQAGIPTEIINHKDYATREAFDQALQELIDSHHPELVVLAGFMRLLSDEFVHHYQGRMLNIHPSLLPEFKGLKTHQRALDAYHNGAITRHGASVHFVTPKLDGGPVILQATVPVKTNDTTESLAARVLSREHQIYPVVIRWFVDGRIQLKGNQVFLDDKLLTKPVLFDSLVSTN